MRPYMSEINKIGVLIVEDEALIAEDIKEICEEAGYDVVSICYRASQALIALQKDNFDLVLLDINLEDELSGIEIAQYILKNKISVPYIFLTSYFDTHTLNEAKDVYPIGYIVKPFRKEQLISTIEISLYNHTKFKIPNGLVREDLEAKFNVHFTEREMEILALKKKKKNNGQISYNIFLSINTVKFHIKHIYDKLHVSNRTQLILALAK